MKSKLGHQRRRKPRRMTLETLESRQLLAAIAVDDVFHVDQGQALNVDIASTGYSGGELRQVEQFAAPGNVRQMEYSAEYNLLFLRNSGSAIHVYDVAARAPLGLQFAHALFTDFDLTPDGRYLFAADYGGTETGYGAPINPHYVHRYDLATRTWETKRAPSIAYKIEAVSAQRMILQEQDQHIGIMLADFGSAPDDPMSEIQRLRSGYRGDIEYDHRTQRIYHGSSGSSSQEILVRELAEDMLLIRESTGTYGTAQGFGDSSTLSSDGSRFYYGRLQVEALDVRNNLLEFPEAIFGATPRLAFGASAFYDALTGEPKGSLGFASQTYFVSDDGLHVWAFEDEGDILHHYTVDGVRAGVLENDQGVGSLTAALSIQPANGTLHFQADGTFSYVPTQGFAGVDTFTYEVVDGAGDRASARVTIAVHNENAVPEAVNDNYQVTAGASLVVDASSAYDFPELVHVTQFPSHGNADQIVFSPAYELLFLRTPYGVRMIDTRTEVEVGLHVAHESFRDMDLTPDGEYLFVADYGGEAVGSGTPLRPHYVHRLHLATGVWEVKTAPSIAWKLEAISAERVLLQEGDQHVAIWLTDFGATPEAAMTRLASIGGAYNGDIEYDSLTGRVYHGTLGSSSDEIHVRAVMGDSLVDKGNTGTYGSAQGYGPWSALSADGSRFYYGRLQVEALDVTNNTNVFPETIWAASDKVAFGSLSYYDARTSEARGRLGFSSSIFTVTPDSQQVWAFDPEGDILHRYRLAPVTRLGVLVNDRDADGEALVAQLAAAPGHGSVELAADGTFTYTPDAGFSGIDKFSYVADDGHGHPRLAQVTIEVQPPVAPNRPPVAVDDTHEARGGEPLLIGTQPWRDVAGHAIATISSEVAVRQIEHSPHFNLVFARGQNSIHIFDAQTGIPVGVQLAANSFFDMDLTLDGRYLFASDYGREVMGSGKPVAPHYVHRFDLATRSWDVQYTPRIAYRIEAVDRNHVLLQEHDQHIDITYEYFSDWPDAALEELSRVRGDYYGDFEYDPRSQRIYHGNSGSSSSEIHVRRLVAGQLFDAGSTGIYGTAEDHGGTSVLSSDGKHFYYGRLQVEALDVRNNLRVFPEAIYAATDQVAFGKSAYYNAKTGQRLGDVGFASDVWFTGDDGRHVWTADSAGTLHHFDLQTLGGVLANDADPDGDALQIGFVGTPAHGTLVVDRAGAVHYVAQYGFDGVEEITYRVDDGRGGSDFGVLRIHVTSNTAPTDIRLSGTVARERVAAAVFAAVTVDDIDPLDTHTLTVSDARFEVSEGLLRLKEGIFLDATTESSLSLSITAIDPHGAGFTESFEFTVLANPQPWHNSQRVMDVSGDDEVGPLDALLVINDLNANGPRPIASLAVARAGYFLDTSADDYISAIDAAIVINYLNANGDVGEEFSRKASSDATGRFGSSANEADLPVSELLSPGMSFENVPAAGGGETTDHDAQALYYLWLEQSRGTAWPQPFKDDSGESGRDAPGLTLR